MKKRNLICALFLLSVFHLAQASENPLCDNEYGVCLNGKRTTVYHDRDALRVENCQGFPFVGLYCYINSAVREFSWVISPAKIYNSETEIFYSNSFLNIENTFTLFKGEEEMMYVQAVAEKYTFNFDYHFEYEGYSPLKTRMLKFAAKTNVSLLCDGVEIATSQPFIDITAGSFDGSTIKATVQNANFVGIESGRCTDSVAVKFKVEAQRFKLTKLDITVLQQH